MQTNLLEESYLKHILIATEARDHSAPFRTFFDNWFAFLEGGPFLNGNSRPHWFNNPSPDRHGRALERAHFVSASAAKTLAGLARDRLMKDHAIPVAVLRDLLFEEQAGSVEEIRAFMLRYYRFGIITLEEDRQLNAAGLGSRMPEGWTKNNSPFARYEKIGIVAQDQRGGSSPASLPEVGPVAPYGQTCRLSRLLSSTAPASSLQRV